MKQLRERPVGETYQIANDNRTKTRDFNELLKNNDLGIIDNPLIYREPQELERDVKSFYTRYDLKAHVDEALLIRGAKLAQVAQNENLLKDFIKDCTQPEKKFLEQEENPTLAQQSKELKTCLLACSIAAIVNGWSQASITGANLQWPVEFNLGNWDNAQSWTLTQPWKFGAVNAMTHFAAGMVGSWLSDPLNEHVFGRRGALVVSALVTFIASIGSGFAQSWQALLAWRFILGIGYGAKASVVPIYESEVSPPQNRGRFLVSWQTFTAVGILLGSAWNIIFHAPENPYLALHPKDSTTTTWRVVAWRLQISSAFIPAIPLLCLAFVCSESPRWLAKNGEYAKAFQVLCRLRPTQLQAARDLYSIYAQLRIETLLFSKSFDIESHLRDWTDDTLYQREVKKSSYWRRFRQLFSIVRNRRACLAAFIVMASQQLSGINIYAFLAATLFSSKHGPTAEASGYSVMESLWLSFGFAAANAIFSPVAYWFIDSRGRRFLLLGSLVAMIPLLIATGFSFKVSDGHSQIAVVALFVILYTAVYSPGAGVVPFLYSSEVFPLINREVGMSFACSVNFLLGSILAFTVPQLNHSLGTPGLLGLFAGLTAAAAVLVWLFVPGTIQVTTLEEMNYIFGVPTRRHVRYQTQKVFPWIIKRVFLGKTRAGELPSLYVWNRSRNIRETEEELKD